MTINFLNKKKRDERQSPFALHYNKCMLIHLVPDLESLNDIIGYSHATFSPVTCRRRVNEHLVSRQSTEISA